MAERGRFITLEGIDGAGKSTSMEAACRHLREHGLEVIETREPGGTALGEALRELLLRRRDLRVDAEAEVLVIFAARAQHLAEVIRPALGEGRWVVCDRFTDATHAYQGGGRGLARERVEALEHWVQQGLRPDLTLLFDVPLSVAVGRAGPRGGWDRFEVEQEAFLERVRQSYLETARREPARVRVIDATPGVAEVQGRVRAILDEFLAAEGITA